MQNKQRPKCPDHFNTDFGRSLVDYLGGDSSKIKDRDCWPRFAVVFPELREAAMKYFAEVKTGEPSAAIYYMVKYCEAPLDWGMRVIANMKVGNPSLAVYYMVSDCRAPLEWGMKVIENTTTGDPSWAAYLMVKYCGAPREWYEKIRKKHDI